ncbi:MAG TPA: Uma2 family endonuclease [Gemmataceae bacterium]|nr:Uma2 family endonuclease [Gemmataceae bacterium]
MNQIAVKIGPADHGRRMSLDDFEHAETAEGRLYELGRGVIIVSDVPNPSHLAQVTAIRRQLSAYDLAHPGRIYTIATGSECKILLSALDSERHPDLAVYRTPPPGDESDVWYIWVPEVVIEVVSPDSEHRDYAEKREEYLAFGVLEYWIFNAERQELLVLRRYGGRWVEQSVRPPQTYSTRRLPGLVIDCAAVFQAARAVHE